MACPVKSILVFNADLIQKQERKVPNYQSLSKLSPFNTHIHSVIWGLRLAKLQFPFTWNCVCIFRRLPRSSGPCWVQEACSLSTARQGSAAAATGPTRHLRLPTAITQKETFFSKDLPKIIFCNKYPHQLQALHWLISLNKWTTLFFFSFIYLNTNFLLLNKAPVPVLAYIFTCPPCVLSEISSLHQPGALLVLGGAQQTHPCERGSHLSPWFALEISRECYKLIFT